MGYQNFFRRNAIETSQRGNSLPTAVHKGGGDQQANILTINCQAAGKAKKLAFSTQADVMPVSQALNKKGASVVAGQVIFRTGISQSYD